MNVPNTGTMQENLADLQGLVRRMRQKEGVGSPEDELILSRTVMDMSELLSIVATFVTRANAETDGQQGVQPN